jgi:CCR4-NOT transcription complex subunit 4
VPQAPSPVLSPSDFPALPTAHVDTQSKSAQPPQPHILPSAKDDKAGKLDRRAKKKAAAAEKAAEKERLAQEKAAEKERLAKEKAAERAAEKTRLAKEKADEEKRLAQEKAEKERLAKEKADLEKQKIPEKNATKSATLASKGKHWKSVAIGAESATPTMEGHPKRGGASKTATATVTPDAETPMPILSRMPKKHKPTTKPIKIPKEEDTHAEPASSLASAVTTNSETPQLPATKLSNVAEVDQNVADGSEYEKADPRNAMPALKPKSLTELLRQIELSESGISLEHHAFFDVAKTNTASKVPIDYNTMVRALSAFPASGASYANYSTSSLNDNTVSSFQQLLETLTQTMSDLVQLLPQTTWGSIFDVLSQDLKDLKREYSLHRSTTFDGLVQDDLPDEVSVDDEVYEADPPTPTMDKRARWMEVQLAKLEELHRDVNKAAINAILAKNDRGWDSSGFLPRIGNTRSRFEQLGYVNENGGMRPMTVEELEKKLLVAKEAAVFAETELRETMEALQAMRPRSPDL